MITNKQYNQQKQKTWLYFWLFLISLIVNCMLWQGVKQNSDVCVREAESMVRDYLRQVSSK